ncbi:MAG TPA: 23S rRNA (adenine(2030)-N(6))-methyltransferase RlmJ [Steroidobacteraceae bacterium]
MKYRHSYHAGNFADVHKHVTLLALIAALSRKEKGFAYLETHAGRGAYELDPEGESSTGVERLLSAEPEQPELKNYADAVRAFRKARQSPRAYPGSPLLAAHALRTQDRAVFMEILAEEARALEQSLGSKARVRVECADGFERLRAHLPPPERRGLTLIDPPYEETRKDFQRVTAAVAEALRRFATGVIAVWYPIKSERDTNAWLAELSRQIKCEALVSELWLYPRDSTVALNGSGLLVLNPPYQLFERMEQWLPELRNRLDIEKKGGASVRRTLK